LPFHYESTVLIKYIKIFPALTDVEIVRREFSHLWVLSPSHQVRAERNEPTGRWRRRRRRREAEQEGGGGGEKLSRREVEEERTSLSLSPSLSLSLSLSLSFCWRRQTNWAELDLNIAFLTF